MSKRDCCCIRIPGALLDSEQDSFLIQCSDDDANEFLDCFDDEPSAGQFLGDTYNWDNGDPKTVCYTGDQETLLPLLSAIKEAITPSGDVLDDRVYSLFDQIAKHTLDDDSIDWNDWV